MLVQDWTAFFRLGCINLSGLTPISFHYDFSYGIVHMDLHSLFDKINYFFVPILFPNFINPTQ